MNYAFYISGKSTRFCKFLNQASDEIKEKIKVVISEYKIFDETNDVLIKNNIPAEIFEYSNLNGSNNKEKNLELSNKFLEVLKNRNIDYMISLGNHILSGDLLKDYEYRIINFHPAILPMYPGLKAIDQAVAHGNTFLVGNTAHFVDSGMDTGKIIMQSVVPLDSFFEHDNDYDVVLDLVIDMINKVMYLLENNLIVISNERVKILGANYSKSSTFPDLSKHFYVGGVNLLYNTVIICFIADIWIGIAILCLHIKKEYAKS